MVLKLAACPCMSPHARKSHGVDIHESQSEMPTNAKPNSTTEVTTAKTSKKKSLTASDAPTTSVKIPSGSDSIIGKSGATQNPLFAKPKPNPLIVSGGFSHA